MPFNHGFCPWPGDPCPVCASELLTGHKLMPKLTKLEGERIDMWADAFMKRLADLSLDCEPPVI